jgi:glycosyltransferase involved in cell wall biosynthesis
LPQIPPALRDLKIAIVHYWFLNGLGGERVTRVLARMFPQAEIFTLLANHGAMPPDVRTHRVTTSFLQNVPGSRRWHRHFMPLYPLALEQFDLSKFDLVISAESGPAKGVLTSPATCHICFCHSPMRYLWDMYHQYKNETGLGALGRAVFAVSSHYVRQWDVASAQRVDHFVAISNHVADRIRKFYRREADIIYPPLKVGGYISDRTEDYYLVVSRLVGYKRIDLAIQACNRLGRKLHIIGDGEQYRNLKSLAGPGVKFLGFVSDEEVREQYAHCRALLFPGEEDLGATPVEAQSFGRPVVAYGAGGVLDTVNGFYPGERFEPAHSGVFFDEQSPESLAQAILAFEAVEKDFDRSTIRENVRWFGESRFRSQLYSYIEEKYSDFTRDRRLTKSVPLLQSAAFIG